uniref:Uncharacterized protein n=1 Tax=Timema douglasi TaxID=61478 RepID=A0A7R8VHR0_TIMDO|nr:unnamed protein product [Timema douglasi]
MLRFRLPLVMMEGSDTPTKGQKMGVRVFSGYSMRAFKRMGYEDTWIGGRRVAKKLGACFSSWVPGVPRIVVGWYSCLGKITTCVSCYRCIHEYMDVYSEAKKPDASELINSPFGGRYCGPIPPRRRISLYQVLSLGFFTDKNSSYPELFGGRYSFINESWFPAEGAKLVELNRALPSCALFQGDSYQEFPHYLGSQLQGFGVLALDPRHSVCPQERIQHYLGIGLPPSVYLALAALGLMLDRVELGPDDSSTAFPLKLELVKYRWLHGEHF